MRCIMGHVKNMWSSVSWCMLHIVHGYILFVRWCWPIVVGVMAKSNLYVMFLCGGVINFWCRFSKHSKISMLLSMRILSAMGFLSVSCGLMSSMIALYVCLLDVNVPMCCLYC